jgi:hypothetical protein
MYNLQLHTLQYYSVLHCLPSAESLLGWAQDLLQTQLTSPALLRRLPFSLSSQVKSHYDRRPVDQCVLVSSPVWGSWPDVNYCFTVTVLSKSKSHYDRRPVGQCVLVSSPICGSWPDVNCCLTVTALSISGAPSDERSGLSFAGYVLTNITTPKSSQSLERWYSRPPPS